MPIWGLWALGSIATGLAGFFGFTVGGGVKGAGEIIKYAVIGVIAYFTAKELKLVK